MSAPRTRLVRHWRLLWLPGFAVVLGKHDGVPAVWLETPRRVYVLDFWLE